MVRLTKSNTPKSAMEIAINCLSRRSMTHFELESRLKEKGCEDSEINKTMLRLEEWGYLNDQELALTVCQSRLKRYSRRRVINDLHKRGLSPQLIEQALESNYVSKDEYQQCLSLAERWWTDEEKRWEQGLQSGRIKKPMTQKIWLMQKVSRKLVQRGYPSDMIRSALSQIGMTSNTDEEMFE